MSTNVGDSIDGFLVDLNLRRWHYIGFAVSCFAFAVDFAAIASDEELPTGVKLVLWLVGSGAIVPIALRYLTVFARLPRSHPIRHSTSQSVAGFVRAAIPSRAMRKNNWWLMPFLVMSWISYLLSFGAALLS